MSSDQVSTSDFSHRFRDIFGDNAVLLQGVRQCSSLTNTLCDKIADTGKISEADILENMANMHIVMDQLTILFGENIQKYTTRLHEKKRTSLIQMRKALDNYENG